MYKLIASVSAFTLLGVAALFLTTDTASASCSGPCAKIKVECADGTSLYGPAAQANLLRAACGGRQAAVQEEPPRVIRRQPVTQQRQMIVKPQPYRRATTVVQTQQEARPVTRTSGGNWVTPRPGKCAVGQPAPAYQDAALAAVGMTLTCDSQPGTGGWNFKPLGSAKPAYFKKCVLRLNNAGFTKACKIGFTRYRLEGTTLVMDTGKGIVNFSKGIMGYSFSQN